MEKIDPGTFPNSCSYCIADKCLFALERRDQLLSRIKPRKDSPILSPELMLAARIADSDARQWLKYDQSTDWQAVVRILARNRIPLFPLPDDLVLKGCPLLKEPAFQGAAATDKAAWLAMRAEYAQVCEGLARREVPNVLIKSVGLAPSFPFTSDNVDMLVRPQHVEVTREVLNELGYVELRNIEEPQKFLFRKYQGGQSVSAIHMHGTVGWGVPFLDDDALWTRCRPSPDDPHVTVPSPEDGLLITIAHAFYENKSFKLLDLTRIRHCLRQGDIDFADMERIASGRGWADGLAFCWLICAQLEEWLYGQSLLPETVRKRAEATVVAHPWLSRRLDGALMRPEITFPFRLSFLFGKLLYYKKILSDPQRSLARRLTDVAFTLGWGVKLKLRISGQRGMLISLSGIDGSGKTVHARALVEAFATSDISASYLWSRSGSAAWLGRLSRITRRSGSAVGQPGRADIASALARRRQSLTNSRLCAAWLVLTLADLVVRYNLRVRLPRLWGQVVVCDRYTYDAMVEIAASLPGGHFGVRFAETVLRALCPRPDVAWLLDVPAETSVARQPDEASSSAAAAELTRQRAAYLVLAQRYSLVVLDTHADPEQTTSRIVREIQRRYYQNYGTWVNAMLLSNPRQLNPATG